MFQQVFGREGERTPAQKFVYARLKQAFRFEQLTFEPQLSYGIDSEGKRVPLSQSYDPLAAAKTDGLRGAFIFIRERVEAQYTNDSDM